MRVLCCSGADDYSTVSRVSSSSSSPPRLDVSLNHVPRISLTEVSATPSACSSLNQTSSTAVRDTDVQFLNDTIAISRKPITSHAPRARCHRVNVTVPTDTGHNAAGTRTHTKPRVSFHDVPSLGVVPSAGSTAGTDRQPKDNAVPTADSGE